jgi:hypothetical protein
MNNIVLFICALIFASTICLTGCTQVSPWERGTLAKAQMALDPRPVLNSLDSHVYGSREAASGGGSAGGGGCGCY